MYNYRDYLNFSEKYLMISEDDKDNAGSLLIPSILLSWIAIESFINNMLDDFASLPPDLFQLHERALLLEKQVKFVEEGINKGQFILDKTDYKRIEEKIFFLLAKFGKNTGLDKGAKLWQEFEKLKELRNNLMHPRKNIELDLNIDVARQSYDTAKNIISFVAQHVWDKAIEI